MRIFDVKTNQFVQNLHLDDVFISCNLDEIDDVLTKRNIVISDHLKNKPRGINFEVHHDYTYFSFAFYTSVHPLNETPISLIYNENTMIFIDDDPVTHQFIIDFINQKLLDDIEEESLSMVFNSLLRFALNIMFQAMYHFETLISSIEDDIVINQNEISLKKVVNLKNDSLIIKKYNRQLLYTCESLFSEDLAFSIESHVIKNIDASVHQLYEYANNIHEMCSHLMDVYNSQISANTNNLINKLTIFTVFATPLTVISGIYGMNFTNIPGLNHPLGYLLALIFMVVLDIIIYFILKKIKLL